MQIKLIFNASSGRIEQSPDQLLEIIEHMQAWDFVPEVHLVEQESNIPMVIQDALQRGIQMIVVSGGDGTIENVIGSLVGTDVSLGIIPTGTRNNVALSLGIPEDIPAAVSLLHTGRRLKIDVGHAVCGKQSRFFLETCSIGLTSALFPAADEIQHGNFSRIGDFMKTMISSPAAKIHLTMDGAAEITTQGHVTLIANLPFVGPHYQIVPDGLMNDGFLDILVFSDLSKLDLLNHVTQVVRGKPEDTRIQRFQAKKIDIATYPPMPVMADGFSLGEGNLTVKMQQKALTVIANR